MDEQELRQRLSDPDEEVRREATFKLGGIAPEQAIKLLEQAIGDSSWRVRKAAAEQIIQFEDNEQAIDTLISALEAGDNAGKRNAATEALERMGTRAIPKLIANLRVRDQEIKKFIVDIIGEIREPGTLPDLIGALKEDNENLRMAAAEALGKLGREEAIAPLLELLREEEHLIKFTALKALAEIGRAGRELPEAPLVQALKDSTLRKAAYTALGFSRNLKAVPWLIEGLGDPQRSNREAAVIALVSLYEDLGLHNEEIKKRLRKTAKKRWALGLRKSLKSYRVEVRTSSARVLGWWGRVEAAKDLIELTKDIHTQDVATQALIEMGKQASSALMESLDKDDPSLRRLLCYILGEIGEKKAEEVLLRCLKDKEEEVQCAAALALGKIGSLTALDSLTLMMESEEEENREAVSEALIFLSKAFPQEVIESVRQFLKSQNIFMRVSSLEILGEIGGPEELKDIYFALKDEAYQVRRSAVEILGNKRLEDSVEQISLALADEEAEVRRAAAIALAELGTPRALEALLMALEDQDVWVKRTAIRGLGKIPTRRFREAIRKMLSVGSGVIVISAMEVLAEQEEERESLIPALDHSDPEVTKAGIRLLEKVDSPEASRVLNSLRNHPNKEISQEAERALRNREKRC